MMLYGDGNVMIELLTNSFNFLDRDLQPVHTTDAQLYIYNCLPQCFLTRINQNIQTIKQRMTEHKYKGGCGQTNKHFKPLLIESAAE